MDTTFATKDWSLFFDDKHPDRVIFKERGEKQKEYTLDELCDVLQQVWKQREEWHKEFRKTIDTD